MNDYKFPILNPINFYTKDYISKLPNDFVTYKNSQDSVLPYSSGRTFQQPIDEDFVFQFWLKGLENFDIELRRKGVKLHRITDFLFRNITPQGAEIDDYNILTLSFHNGFVESLISRNVFDCLEFAILNNIGETLYISNMLYINQDDTVLKLTYKDTGLRLGMFFNKKYYILLNKHSLIDFKYNFEDETIQTLDEEIRFLKSFYSLEKEYQFKNVPVFQRQKMTYILGCETLELNNKSLIAKSKIEVENSMMKFSLQDQEFSLYNEVNNTFRFLKANTLRFNSLNDERNNILFVKQDEPTDNFLHLQIETTILKSQLVVTVKNNIGNTVQTIDLTLLKTALGWNYYEIEIDLNTISYGKGYFINIDWSNHHIKSECFDFLDTRNIEYTKISKIEYSTLSVGMSDLVFPNTYFLLDKAETIKNEFNTKSEEFKSLKEQEFSLYSKPIEEFTLRFWNVTDEMIEKLAVISTNYFIFNSLPLIRKGGFDIKILGNGLNMLDFTCQLYSIDFYNQLPLQNKDAWILKTAFWVDPFTKWYDDDVWNDYLSDGVLPSDIPFDL